MSEDKNCLSYWFPKLKDADLPVPRTMWMQTECNLQPLLDGHKPDGWDDFLNVLMAMLTKIGTPCFLRTGQGSGKHDWENTCYLQCPGDLERHVAALVEWSAIVDMLGLPVNVWAVRDLLPTIPFMYCPRYGNFPVCKEFRCFVRDGQGICCHPYWPRKSLVKGMAIKRLDFAWTEVNEESLRELPDNFDDLYCDLCYLSFDATCKVRALAEQAGKALGGYWSVDVLWTKRGWFITDCALGEQSYHWEGCEHGRTH